MFLLLSIFLVFLSPLTGDAQTAVAVTAQPDKIYIERGEGGEQHLNFDFILKNQTEEKLIINKVELSVYDEAGKLARREFMMNTVANLWNLPPRRQSKSKARRFSTIRFTHLPQTFRLQNCITNFLSAAKTASDISKPR